MSATGGPAPPRHQAVVGALRAFSELSDQAADDAGRELGLGRTDLRALTVLMRRAAAGEETTVTDLGRGLHLSKPAASAAVDRLVASGHAVRRRSEGDRRRVIVDHTDSALTDGRAAFLPLATRISGALEAFSDAELDAALRVVAAAAAALGGDVPAPAWPATSGSSAAPAASTPRDAPLP
ncbi:MarR family winged helix-turn-helix transcriptional regulator [Micrococcus sp.]|uniref:MarR family winged helix-turn-helix transcriptional regulator n=1 Tax=Micrococcus sp. TaxID=1271 RepID=UPI0026DBD03F|nr:MarR family winged helix-turn-helix transcriptional regulator [Micrococcus sp.]MDO4240471.1 MarR family winged helix-turn-helix transcriptional regulator [Micrococcus sp.]